MVLLGLLVIVGLILAIRNTIRISDIDTALTRDTELLRDRVGQLETQLSNLRRRLEAHGIPMGKVPPKAPSDGSQVSVPAAGVPVQPPAATPAAPPAPVVQPPAAAAGPGRGVAVPPGPTAPPPPPAPAVPPAGRTPVEIRAAVQPAAQPRPVAKDMAPPPVARAVPPAPSPAVEAPAAPDAHDTGWSFDWESLIGVKLFSWIAGIALVIAGIFFLGYSIEQGWLQPPVRVIIGIVVGLGLLVVCELKAARSYPITANALDAAGIAILFSTFFAAHVLWHLFGPRDSAYAIGLTFFLLVAVAAVGVLLSIRRDSLFIALLGLVGGFAVPALLSTGQDNPFGLFGYLLILNAGLSAVAYRKKWPLLTVICLAFTTLYQWAWVGTFLTEAKLPIALGIFLVFPVLGMAGLMLARPRGTGARESLFEQVAGISAGLPLLFALYLAAGPAFVAHWAIVFGFLFVLDVGLFAIASTRGPEILHLGSAAATFIVCWSWLNNAHAASAVAAAWPAVAGLFALFVLFYLLAPFVAPSLGRPLVRAGSNAVFVAPLLLSVFTGLVALEPVCAAPGLLFSVLFLLNVAIAAVAVGTGRSMLIFLAGFFTLAAEAIWSARYLTPATLPSALLIYGTFGLLYLAVPALARRWKRPLEPEGASGLFLLFSLALLFFLGHGRVAPVALGGLALLLAILNVAIAVEGRQSRLPGLAAIGGVLSWLILGFWWAQAPVDAMLQPALLVLTGLALLTLVVQIWLSKTTGETAAPPREGIFLSLAGFAFLLFVVGDPSLSVPPWPWLAVLAVLLLALGAAALYTRRPDLHVAALASSQVVVLVWVSATQVAPWPALAVVFAAGVAALAGAWMLLARRRGVEPLLFDAGAAGSLVLAQLVALIAAAQPGSPGVAFLALAHVVLVVALLALTVFRGWQMLAIGAVALPSLGTIFWQFSHLRSAPWSDALVFALPIYLVFIAYPLVIGRRLRAAIEPYQAAVLASVSFFMVARLAFVEGGLAGIIGVVPVGQAALMAILLVQLLRLEPAGARTLGRLALVAGAALAFVTVAIPLQLDREWITIGWALEGAALAWLFVRIPHRGLFWSSVGLLALAFVRLALNPEVFAYQPRGTVRIWNWYLYTYLVSSAALLAGAWLFEKTNDRIGEELPRASTLFKAGGAVLLFLLLNIEIADFYAVGETITFNLSGTFAQDLTYTLGWALFGVGLLAVGIVLRSHAGRVAALVLLTITIVKCFLFDLARLTGLYRVASFVGLAVCLALVAVVLQKFVLATRTKERG